MLALAQYFVYEEVRNPYLLDHIAELAPNSIIRAVRYSGIVLKSGSLKWQELSDISRDQNGRFDEMLAICTFFQKAHKDRVTLVTSAREPLKSLTPLEILSYCSLFAFQHLLVPSINVDGDEVKQDTSWETLSNILTHTLKHASSDALKLTESKLGRSLKRHMAAVIFPSPELTPKAIKLYQGFSQLFFAQLELDRFISESVNAFCYDDNSRYTLVNARLELETLNPQISEDWDDANNKLLTLQGYWLNRGIEEFTASPMSQKIIGCPENHEDNAMAVIRAMGTKRELQEIYGLGDTITTDNGLQVDTYQALLASYLNTEFYKTAFIAPFQQSLAQGSNWQEALTKLAMDGLIDGMQNRFPLTHSTEKDKAKNIVGWTVNEQSPSGNLNAARAILDFWTVDLTKTAKQLISQPHRPQPNLYERSFFKIGNFSFQAPWLIAFQNNSTAAINNLRRIGSQRQEAHSETARIEQVLAEAFKARGFHVMVGFHPERTETSNPGEIDLIAQLDNQLLVIEVKSSYLRSSAREIWQYKVQTLRKAGEQANRKTESVRALLTTQPEAFKALGIQSVDKLNIHSWIVDTTIEHDHVYFSGALKVSIQEVLIALRDDAHLLVGLPYQLQKHMEPESSPNAHTPKTLYPKGFSANAFIETIYADTIWEMTRQK